MVSTELGEARRQVLHQRALALLQNEGAAGTELVYHAATTSGTFTIGGDLAVYRLGFGTMRLTGPGIWGPPADKNEAITVLRRAIELGVNLIDTADSYGPEVSESLIAEALYPYPPQLLIATKGGYLLKRRTGKNVVTPTLPGLNRNAWPVARSPRMVPSAAARSG